MSEPRDQDDVATKAECWFCKGRIGRRCTDCNGTSIVSCEARARQKLCWPDLSDEARRR